MADITLKASREGQTWGPPVMVTVCDEVWREKEGMVKGCKVKINREDKLTLETKSSLRSTQPCRASTLGLFPSCSEGRVSN